jgi:hypothetical protein
MIVDYHNKSEAELRFDPWYSLWLDSKVKPGQPVRKPKNHKISIFERIMKPGEYEITSVEKKN